MPTPKTIHKEKIRNFQDIECGRRILRLSERTYVMGILNMTPDSFSDGGEFFGAEKGMSRIEQMVKEGADIIDIGGESTRPGSEPVSAEEEMERVIPVIKKAASNIDAPVSIDTRKSEVAEAALRAGASIVNDITALRGDARMRDVVAGHRAAVILMHMKGEPKTMQVSPEYGDLFSEVISYLAESVKMAKEAGIQEEKIIVDPGIGFGKSALHNLLIIKNLHRLKELNRPILIGVSRKSFMRGVLEAGVKERLMGTAASAAVSILNGANIIRVHDVRPMVEVARLTDAIRRAEEE